jgi:hypothetical protein
MDEEGERPDDAGVYTIISPLGPAVAVQRHSRDSHMT